MWADSSQTVRYVDRQTIRHTYTDGLMDTDKQTQPDTEIYTHTHARTHARMHACTHACMCARIHTYIHTHAQTNVSTKHITSHTHPGQPGYTVRINNLPSWHLDMKATCKETYIQKNCFVNRSNPNNANEAILVWGDVGGFVNILFFNSANIALFERPPAPAGEKQGKRRDWGLCAGVLWWRLMVLTRVLNPNPGSGWRL